jgi:hypothetical protein
MKTKNFTLKTRSALLLIGTIVILFLLIKSDSAFTQRIKNVSQGNSHALSVQSGVFIISSSDFGKGVMPVVRAFDENNNGTLAFIAVGESQIFLLQHEKKLLEIPLPDVPEEISLNNTSVSVLISKIIYRYSLEGQLLENRNIDYTKSLIPEGIIYDESSLTYMIYNNSLEQTSLIIKSDGNVQEVKGWKMAGEFLSANRTTPNTYELHFGDIIKTYTSEHEVSLVRFVGVNGSSYKLLRETLLDAEPQRYLREIVDIDRTSFNEMSTVELPENSEWLKRDFSFNTDKILRQDSKGIYIGKPDEIRNINIGSIERTFESEPCLKNPELPKATITRSQIITNADPYIGLSYTVKPVNTTTSSGVSVGSKLVITPWYLSSGTLSKTGEAYMWGGFATPSNFTSGLASNKYCGDKNCTGNGASSSSVYGIDCSGLVLRSWGFTSKDYSSSSITGIAPLYQNNKYNGSLITDWTRLNRGDVIQKTGHVILSRNYNSDGSLCVSESSGNDWKCSTRNYSISSLSSAYTPRYYQNTNMSVLRMSSSIGVVGGNIITKNTTKTFSVTLANTGSAAFSGNIIFQLFTSTGSWAADLGVITNTSISAGSTKTFSVSKLITNVAGSYLVCVKAMEVNGTYSTVLKKADGSITNWLPVSIVGAKNNSQTNLETSIDNKDVVIFPNPSYGLINVEIPEDGYNIEIIDVMGKIIFSESNLHAGYHVCDLSGQFSGYYFVKTFNSKICNISKLLIDYR